MKTLKTIIIICIISFSEVSAQIYEFDFVTVIESIVPSGLGRSRMISKSENIDYKIATTTRNKEVEKEKNKAKRSDIRTYEFEETKLLNFYNLGGIRFNNIATNDAMVKSKLNEMSINGWELFSVTSGVESSGDKDNNGIYVTRYLFRKENND